MPNRDREGATLALTATIVFFIIILGVGFFFLVNLIGGGREAQHATDAGNLNLAKAAMLHPSTPGLTSNTYYQDQNGKNVDETQDFAGLLDNGNTMDLQDYNRLVGKALLVAMNACAENTAQALTNAQTEINVVEGQHGIGDRLAQSLADPTQTQQYFSQVADSNSLRMLNWNGLNAIQNDPTGYKTSFLRQFPNSQAPTNLAVNTSIFPNGINVVVGTSSKSAPLTISSNNNTTYLIGYTPITVQPSGASTSLTVYGVPVRPGQQPHLVSQAQFTAEESPPTYPGFTPYLPPNTFQSQSQAPEMHNTSVQMRSSAIVGCLGIQYNMSIPNGYVVLDNSGSINGTGYTTSPAANALTGDLMAPGVYAFDNAFFLPANSNTLSQLSQIENASYPTPMSLAQGIQPAAPDQAHLDAIHSFLASNDPSWQTACTNTNSAMGDPNLSQYCYNQVSSVYNFLGTGGTTTTGGVGALMAIEYIKEEIIIARGSVNLDDGCTTIGQAWAGPTGLKGYNHNGSYNQVPFDDTSLGDVKPTLLQLLLETTDTSYDSNGKLVKGAVYNSIEQRMWEMNPAASTASMDAAISSLQVPFAAVSFLFWNGTAFVSAPAPPSAAATIPADGLAMTPVFWTGSDTSGELINVDGDGGFPHPFDCPPGASDVDKDQVQWTPSSGFQQILGVAKFTNWANTPASSWCCPC